MGLDDVFACSRGRQVQLLTGEHSENTLKIVREPLDGAFLLQTSKFQDRRGTFVKTFHQPTFSQLGIDFDIREEFYSVSNKGVIRGMHFQIPPYEHDKIVTCLDGRVLDVLLDLRSGKNYGQSASVELSVQDGCFLVIPRGVAHGFLALSDHALLLYKTNTPYESTADRGIRWDSFGFHWGVEQPILSARDQLHPPLSEFVTPF